MIQPPPVPSTCHSIRLRGIREALLAGADVEIPLGCIVCIVGTGAHIVARRVLLAESRRRYLLSLTPFERERLGGIGARAAVDGIDGLPPAQGLPASISDSASVASRLHIVADLVAVVRARARVVCGHCGGHCIRCTEDDVARLASERFADGALNVIAPMQLDRAAIAGVAAEVERAGFRRVRVDGQLLRWQDFDAAAVDDELQVVVDRMTVAARTAARVGDAVRTARAMARGRALLVDDDAQVLWVDSRRACLDCGQRVEEPDWEALAEGAQSGDSVQLDDGAVSHTVTGLRLGDMEKLTGDAGSPAAIRLRSAASLCVDMGLAGLTVWQPLQQLSHGEGVLLEIAAARCLGLAGILHVVLSPPSALDSQTRQLVYAGLRHLVQGGASVVILDEGDASMADTVVRVDQVPASEPETRTESRPDCRQAGPGAAALHDVEQVTVGPVAEGDVPVPADELTIPLNRLVVVTGGRGSGKTRLLDMIESASGGARRAGTEKRVRAPAVRRVVAMSADVPTGVRWLSELLGLQRPLARLFADGPVAREQQLSLDAFLLDKAGGRCPACEGEGIIRHRLDVLEDVAVTCSRCQGRRYRDEILAATSHGVSIADASAMTVAVAAVHFARERVIGAILAAAEGSGLGERRLDEPVVDLNDAQRLLGRLVRQHAATRRGDLVLLDRPHAGATPAAGLRLVQGMRRLVLAGASVIATDAAGDLAQHADHVIELAPTPRS